MSLLKKLAGQTALYGLSSVLGRFLNTFILTPYHTRKFGMAGFGLATSWYSYISFWNVFLTFGMETAFFRYIKERKGDPAIYRQTLHFILKLSSAFLLVAGILCAYFYLQGENVAHWILIAGILWLDAVSALPLAKLRYEEKAARFAFINLTNIAITIIANIFLIEYLEIGPLAAIIANFIASLIRTALAFQGAGLPEKGNDDAVLMKELRHYGGFIMLAGLAGMMNETLDRAIIPELWQDGQTYKGIARTGQEMNGLYAAGYRFGIFLSLFTQAFRYAVEPFFFKQNGEKDSPETFAKIFHYYILFCLAGFLLVASFTYEIVQIKVFGYTFIHENLWQGLEVAAIILLAYVFQAVYMQISVWFKLTGKTKYALWFTGLGAGITLLGNLLFVPKFGYLASAYSTLICYVVMSVAVYYFGQKHYPVPYKILRLGLYLFLILAAYFLSVYIGHETLQDIGLKAAINLLTLGGIALLEWKQIREPNIN